MAQSNRKPTKKAPPAKITRAAGKNASRRHVWSVVLFALGIFTVLLAFIGNVNASEPSFWDLLHRFLRGTLGISAFVAGPILIYAAIMISADTHKSTVTAKLFQMFAVLLLLSGAVQIIFVGRVGLEGEDFFQSVSTVYQEGTNLHGGGVLSIVAAYPLLLFGRVGGSILIILISFVFIMLMANIGLMDFLHALTIPFKALARFVRKRHDDYQQEKELLEWNKNEQMLFDVPVNKKEEKKRPVNEKFKQISAVTTAAHLEPKEETPISPIAIYQEKQSEEFNQKLDAYLKNDEPAEVISEGPSEAEKTPAVLDAIAEYQKEQTEEETRASQVAMELEQSPSDIPIETDENGQAHFVEPVKIQQYTLPPIELLNEVVKSKSAEDIQNELEANSITLVETLNSFGVQTRVIGYSRGPSVTRYELQPAAGVKISKITGLVDDIALNLATAGVRIEAPIPNKAAVGIEVPNKTVETVPFREMVDSAEFRFTQSKLGAALGRNLSGEIVIADIAKMPHILIAGTTGSGKSVCVNSIIMSILFRSTPDEVRLIMVDPKAVEFMIYNGIPHLLIPVVTDPKKAAKALGWAVGEMMRRYKLFSDNNARDLEGYNKIAKKREDMEVLPQIVIFIDELADLMMVSPGEVEDTICRLAQMARAAGMHLVIATQRPSVNVVTGLIKANIPSRIALKVASQVDSRTILDSAGAEKLLGKGDMLYSPVGSPKPIRVQGCWVSEKEVERVADFIRNSFVLDYDQAVIDEIERQAELADAEENTTKSSLSDMETDDKLDEAIEAVIEAGQASTSYLQRKLKLGYGRAARLIDMMEEMGVVGPFEGSKPRQVIMTRQEWYERKLNR